MPCLSGQVVSLASRVLRSLVPPGFCVFMPCSSVQAVSLASHVLRSLPPPGFCVFMPCLHVHAGRALTYALAKRPRRLFRPGPNPLCSVTTARPRTCHNSSLVGSVAASREGVPRPPSRQPQLYLLSIAVLYKLDVAKSSQPWNGEPAKFKKDKQQDISTLFRHPQVAAEDRRRPAPTTSPIGSVS